MSRTLGSGMPARKELFAARIDRLINDSPKSQQEMAEALGYDHPNPTSTLSPKTEDISVH